MTARPTRPRHRFLFLILAAVLAAAGGGCAGKVETIHESPGFARSDLAAGRLGVGGVVLSARLAIDPVAGVPDGAPAGDVLAQADLWSSALYGPLLAAGPEVAIWPWPAVREACGDSALADLLGTFARGGVPRPEQLVPLGALLGEVRYLALARVEGDETTLNDGPGAAVDQQRARDGRDVHGNPQDRALTTRRKLTVTLEVYDLAAGRSLWAATAERHRDELYNFADAAPDERPPVVATGEPVITAGGKPLPAAAFAPVLQDACAALAHRLLAPPAP